MMTLPPEQQPHTPPRLKILLPLAAACLAASLVIVSAELYTPSVLTLESDPGGASVFLNGRLAGATPLSVSGLDAGAYSLRLEKDGCLPVSRLIQVSSGSTHIRENLPPRGVGSLNVDVAPQGAEVLLDGELIGHTPLSVPNVLAGAHELQVRRTNFKTYSQRIEMLPGAALDFKDFGLEDLVLAMLQNTIEKDKQRVANYCDLAHYYFANNKLKEAGDVYARAIQVGGTPLVYQPEMTAAERDLEKLLRTEDINRLNDEIRKKTIGHGKVINHDLAAFREELQRQQELNANKNIANWDAVEVQVNNLIQDVKFEQAEELLQRHLAESAKGVPTLAQAYIALFSLRIKMHKVPGVKEAYDEFSSLFAARPDLARQAANTLYTPAASFEGKEREALLTMAETLLRRSVDASPRHSEMNALCKFELGNVLCLQGHYEQAMPLYKDSIDGTSEPSTKELRSLRLVDAVKMVKNYSGAKKILAGLVSSPRAEIARRAKDELNKIEAAEQK